MKILFFIMIFIVSCSKELTLSKEDLINRAKNHDPSLIVSSEKISSCDDYSEGCLSTQTLILNELKFIAVEFSSIEKATIGGKKIRGYQVENWVLDDVRGEPILERFAVHGLQAKML